LNNDGDFEKKVSKKVADKPVVTKEAGAKGGLEKVKLSSVKGTTFGAVKAKQSSEKKTGDHDKKNASSTTSSNQKKGHDRAGQYAAISKAVKSDKASASKSSPPTGG
jgi:hypothetical protein